MPKKRPSNYEIKTARQLQDWFEKNIDGFCYVTGKVRQYWYIGHNNLVINGKSFSLEFRDMAGGVWLVIVKDKENNINEKEKTCT